MARFRTGVGLLPGSSAPSVTTAPLIDLVVSRFAWSEGRYFWIFPGHHVAHPIPLFRPHPLSLDHLDPPLTVATELSVRPRVLAVFKLMIQFEPRRLLDGSRVGGLGAFEAIGQRRWPSCGSPRQDRARSPAVSTPSPPTGPAGHQQQQTVLAAGPDPGLTFSVISLEEVTISASIRPRPLPAKAPAKSSRPRTSIDWTCTTNGRLEAEGRRELTGQVVRVPAGSSTRVTPGAVF